MLQGGAREVWRRTIAIQKRKLKLYITDSRKCLRKWFLKDKILFWKMNKNTMISPYT